MPAKRVNAPERAVDSHAGPSSDSATSNVKVLRANPLPAAQPATPPGLRAVGPLALAAHLGNDDRTGGVDDVLGLVEQGADLLGVSRRLLFDRRGDEAADRPSRVTHASLVLRTVG